MRTKVPRKLLAVERITRLGLLGESLAEECLLSAGFYDVQNLNKIRANYPYADLLAKQHGKAYFIGVKARNEQRADGKINEAYNVVLIPNAQNRLLKSKGLTADKITEMLLAEVHNLASEWQATPSWVAIALRPDKGSYSAYFGLLDSIGNRRSIPMRLGNRNSYELLANNAYDRRITRDSLNR